MTCFLIATCTDHVIFFYVLYCQFFYKKKNYRKRSAALERTAVHTSITKDPPLSSCLMIYAFRFLSLKLIVDGYIRKQLCTVRCPKLVTSCEDSCDWDLWQYTQVVRSDSQNYFCQLKQPGLQNQCNLFFLSECRNPVLMESNKRCVTWMNFVFYSINGSRLIETWVEM